MTQVRRVRKLRKGKGKGKGRKLRKAGGVTDGTADGANADGAADGATDDLPYYDIEVDDVEDEYVEE